LLLAGCAAERATWPEERLDPRTAVNLTIMAEPWVYAREAREIAVNARDYLHVGMVETNRSGQRAYWLGVIAWSTVDRSAAPDSLSPIRPGVVVLQSGDASVRLEPEPAGRGAIGAGEPVFPGPQRAFDEAWYRLGSKQVLLLARMPPETVTLVGTDREAEYRAWRVRPTAAVSFVQAIGLDRDAP